MSIPFKKQDTNLIVKPAVNGAQARPNPLLAETTGLQLKIKSLIDEMSAPTARRSPERTQAVIRAKECLAWLQFEAEEIKSGKLASPL